MKLLWFFAVTPALLFGADYANDIHPLLASRCLGCHTGAQAQAGLDLSTRNGAARVLTGADPLLLARVEGRAGKIMPPVGKPLEAAQVQLLKDWLAAGAPYTDLKTPTKPAWSAPLELTRVNVPPGQGNPIDRFLGAPAAGLATDAAFARRAYLDLWGIAPPPADLAAFTQNKNPQKRSDLINHLLADERRYTGHYISWWNDLLRNDIGVIYHGERKSITPWLETALRTNLPYDEMVRELVNPIGANAPEGFLIGVNWRGEVNASQTPFMQASQNTAQVFLGINLKCASCHDSFINQYKLKQAYGLAAFFAQPDQLELVRCDNRTGVFQQAEFLWPELGAVPADLSPSERRLWAARLFTHPKNGRLARTIVNRYWQKLIGKGLVEPVDDMDVKPSHPELLDWLAGDFVAHGYDLKHLLRQIMTSAAYQRHDAAPRRISAEQFTDTLSAVTGEWQFQQSNNSSVGMLGRDWQFKSTPLSRALGRPIRDQVYTTRNEEATTFQGLELANGPTLASLIHRGSRRLLGEIAPAPQSLFDSLAMRNGERTINIPIRGLSRIWLLTEDAGTYDPARAIVGWRDITVLGPAGAQMLEGGVVRTPLGTRLVYELPPGYDTLRATAWISEESRASDINAYVRFFAFGAEPDRTRLVRVTGDSPWPAPPYLSNATQAIDYLWQSLLSRQPSPPERQLALALFPNGELRREGVEDLIWSLMMHPEFQYIW